MNTTEIIAEPVRRFSVQKFFISAVILFFGLFTSISSIFAQTRADDVITLSEKDFLSCEKQTQEKCARALKEGFFYLEIPEDCDQLLDEAIEFAKSFYKNDSLKDLKLAGFSGYQDREHAQIESFYCERTYWEKIFSARLQTLSIKMDALALEVLKMALHFCNFPESIKNKAVGGLLENQGMHHFSFNHYRPEKDKVGLKEHRDFGYVTLLYINKEGLEARIDDEWVNIPPKKGHFVVNFGRAFEVLVNDPKLLKGAWHRVRKVNEDRVSFGVFLDSSLHMPVYCLAETGKLEIVNDNYAEFIQECFDEVYRPE